jgi:hypothetical protein
MVEEIIYEYYLPEMWFIFKSRVENKVENSKSRMVEGVYEGLSAGKCGTSLNQECKLSFKWTVK